MNEQETKQKIKDLEQERDLIYKTVQDFTVSHQTAHNAIERMKPITKQIKELEEELFARKWKA